MFDLWQKTLKLPLSQMVFLEDGLEEMEYVEYDPV